MALSIKERPLKEFLSIGEVSEYLGIKKSSLYVKVERKEIPYYKIGHLLRFKRSDIDSWMEKLKSEPVDPQKEPKRIRRTNAKSAAEIDAIVRKSIAEAKGMTYNPDHGKPDRIKGLRKEVSNGSL